MQQNRDRDLIHNSSNKTNKCSSKVFSYVIEQPPAFDTPVENQLHLQEYTSDGFVYVQNNICFKHSKLPK